MTASTRRPLPIAALLAALAVGCADGGGSLPSDGLIVGSWLRVIGGPLPEEPIALAADAQGSLLLLATFEGALDAGGGPLEATSRPTLLLTQLDPDGTHRWSRAVDQSQGEVEIAKAIATETGWLVAGTFFGRSLDLGAGPLDSDGGYSGFATALDSGGGITWQSGLQGGGSLFLAEVAPGVDGFTWGAGRFEGALTTTSISATVSASGADAFLVRWAPDGRVDGLWGYGGPDFDAFTALAPRPDGGVWVGGLFRGSTELQGQRIEGRGENDIYLASVDAEGRVQSVLPWASPAGEELSELALTDRGDLVGAGGLSGPLDVGGGPLLGDTPADIFVAGWDAAGQHRFSRRLGGRDFDVVRGLSIDEDGRVLLAGTFRGDLDLGAQVVSSPGHSDGFVLALSPVDGQTEALRIFGSPDVDDVVADICAVPGGVALLAGIQGETDFGFAVGVSAGAFDVLVAKLVGLR